MTTGIDPAHLQFFRKNGKIEFENLLFSRDIECIHTAFKKSVEGDRRGPPYPLKYGFDLFRSQPHTKNLIINKRLAHIAAQLVEVKKIRFGLSQYLSEDCYDNDFAYQHRKSCIRQLICGLCLALEPAPEPENPYFPNTKGSGIFFSIDDDFYLKFPQTRGKYLFILYACARSNFVHSEDDPLTPRFRSLGYEHGDLLTENLHPSYSWMVI